MKNKKHFEYLPYALIVLIALSGFLYLENVKRDYNEQLSIIVKGVNQLGDALMSVRANLSSEITLLDYRLESSKKENKQKIDTLTKIVNQLKEKSSAELEALKNELASIDAESSDFSTVIENVLPSVVSVLTENGQGSGAIIRDNGYIVTNLHVVSGASRIRVLTHDGITHDAKWIGANSAADVAVLKIDGDYKELDFGDSDIVKVGEKVIALGNPGGLDFSVTEGIVSAVHRTDRNGVQYIQTDVPINPGNSGGPLVDKNSRIIGINNWKIAGFEGLGFAIESNIVEDSVDEIINKYEGAS